MSSARVRIAGPGLGFVRCGLRCIEIRLRYIYYVYCDGKHHKKKFASRNFLTGWVLILYTRQFAREREDGKKNFNDDDE